MAKFRKSENCGGLTRTYSKNKQLYTWKDYLDTAFKRGTEKFVKAQITKESVPQSLTDIDPQTNFLSEPPSDKDTNKPKLPSSKELSTTQSAYMKLIESMSAKNQKLLSDVLNGLKLTTEHNVWTETEEDFKEYRERVQKAETCLEYEAHEGLWP